MIIAAFSTLGKTTYVKETKGLNFDFEVNKFSKNCGFPGWDEVPTSDRKDFAEILRVMDEDYFNIVFVTIPEILTYLRAGTQCAVVVPSFGVEEFRRRLELRGKPAEEQDEWKILGGGHYLEAIQKYRSVVDECKKRGVRAFLIEGYYLSDVLKKGKLGTMIDRRHYL